MHQDKIMCFSVVTHWYSPPVKICHIFHETVLGRAFIGRYEFAQLLTAAHLAIVQKQKNTGFLGHITPGIQ